MTRDEIRSLLGGYATGSLSEAERRILLEAALDDQELFDELGREQALKELLDQSGAKSRLAAVLAPAPKPRWRLGWVWAATSAAAAIAVVSIVLLTRPAPKPAEVAQAELPKLAEPAPAPVAPLNVTEPHNAPQPAAQQPRRENAPRSQAAPAKPDKNRDAVNRIAEPSPAPAAAAPPPAPAAVQGQLSPPRTAFAQAPPPPPAPKSAATGATAEAVTVTAEGTLLKTESGAAANAQTSDVSTLPPLALGAVQAGAPPAGVVGGVPGGGGGGGRGGAGGRARIAPQAAARLATPSFAFDYSVTPQGALRIVPTAAGFLSVTASNAAGTSTTVVTGRQLQPGVASEIALPADAAQAILIFSAQANPPAFVGDAAGGPSPPSGTKSDPNPSPNSVIYAVIRVKP